MIIYFFTSLVAMIMQHGVILIKYILSCFLLIFIKIKSFIFKSHEVHLLTVLLVKFYRYFRYFKLKLKKSINFFKFKFNKLVYIKKELSFLYYKFKNDIYKYNYLIYKYQLMSDLYIFYYNWYRNWWDPFKLNLEEFNWGIQQSSFLSYSFLVDALLYFWCFYYGELYFYYWCILLIFKYLFSVLLTAKRGQSDKSIFCLHTFLLLSKLITSSLYVCLTVWNPYTFIVRAFFFKYGNQYLGGRIHCFFEVFFAVPLMICWLYFVFRISFPTIAVYWGLKLIQLLWVSPISTVLKTVIVELSIYKIKILGIFLLFIFNFFILGFTLVEFIPILIIIYLLYLFNNNLHLAKYNYKVFIINLYNLHYEYIMKTNGCKIRICYRVIPYSNNKNWTLLIKSGSNIIKYENMFNWAKDLLREDVKSHVLVPHLQGWDSFTHHPGLLKYIILSKKADLLGYHASGQCVTLGENTLEKIDFPLYAEQVHKVISAYPFVNYTFLTGLSHPLSNQRLSDSMYRDIATCLKKNSIYNQEDLVNYITQNCSEPNVLLDALVSLWGYNFSSNQNMNWLIKCIHALYG